MGSGACGGLIAPQASTQREVTDSQTDFCTPFYEEKSARQSKFNKSCQGKQKEDKKMKRRAIAFAHRELRKLESTHGELERYCTDDVIMEGARAFNEGFEKIKNAYNAKKDAFEPHEGDTMSEWLDKLDSLSNKLADYSTVLKSREADEVIRKVERLLYLFLTLRGCSSYSSACAAILQYVSAETGESPILWLKNYIFEAWTMAAHDGVEGGSSRPEWLDAFKTATSNWKLCYKLPAWKYLQKILSMAVSVGLCRAADCSMTIGELKLFTLKVNEKQANAVDLIDAILSTADYFVEAGYEAYQTKSIRPFLFDNQTARILDEAYVSIAASMKALITGDLDKTKYKSEDELAHVLENTHVGYTVLALQCKDKFDKKTLDFRCMQLEQWKLQFVQSTIAGGLREAPEALYLVGDPGIGKSMMTQVFIETVLVANGIKYTQKQIATVNPGDKFASTVKNDTVAIILDDFGQFVLQFEQENPLKYVIEICNNVVSYVPKADVAEKGKVGYRPKIVVLTSNLDEMMFNQLSNCPGAAKRRGIRIKPTLKEEFATNGRFDDDKVRAHYLAQGIDRIPLTPDVYNIDVMEWGTKKWQYMKHMGKTMEKVDYATTVEFVIQHSIRHFRKQKNLVRSQASIGNQIQLCEHMNLQSNCQCCRDLPALSEDEVVEKRETYASHFVAPLLPTQEEQAHEEAREAEELARQTVEDEAMLSEHQKVKDILSDAFDDLDDMEPHFGTEFIYRWMWSAFLGMLWRRIVPYFTNTVQYVQNQSTENLMELERNYHFMRSLHFTDYLPDWVFDSALFRTYKRVFDAHLFMQQSWQLRYGFLMSLLLFGLHRWGALALNLCVIWPYIGFSAHAMYVTIAMEFYNRRGALPVSFTRRRDGFLRYAAGGCLALTGFALLYKLYSARSVVEPHGNIQPKEMADIHARDSEQSDWHRVEVEPLPASDKSKCETIEKLKKKVCKNLVYVSYEDEEGVVKNVDGLMMCSNELVIPYHIVADKPRKYTIYRQDAKIKGVRFFEEFGYDDVVVHPSSDYCMVQCANTSPFADLRPFLALKNVDNSPFIMCYQPKTGDHIFAKGTALWKRVSNGVRRFNGYYYKLDKPTFRGQCMATMISDTKSPMIIGAHIGGRTGTEEGIAISFTYDEYEAMAKQYFEKHPSALRHSNEGKVFEAHLGIEWFESPEIHPKSPINFIPGECNLRYFGSCKGRATYYSEVVQTPISQLVEEVCGHTQDYSGPQFHRWKSWYESLVFSSDPSAGCDTATLNWAWTDYFQQVLSILEIDGIADGVRPLTEIEIVSGIDGLRFVDAMPPNTAPGYPDKGKKRDKMIDLEPNDQHNCPRTFKPEIWAEYDKHEAEWAKGSRTYPMFKACLKDEPTKVEKTKVRVFQAAPLVLQIGIRKYFLPLARLLSLCPLKSECAVGINAQGTEWHVLQEAIKKFGEERIVAGDYSKYDLRMSAKLTSAAFQILISFAKEIGWDERTLMIMGSIATEVVYPMMSYNGDVVMLQGSNPSGQNLTVYINSIVNSLLNRIGFKKVCPLYNGKFSDVVSLITYGDDFKSSASDEVPEFHHISLAEKLEGIDMKITMPDKEATPVPFLSDEDCDFLKRHNILHEVGFYVGALDEESIMKSLKAVLRSKHCSTKEQAAQNIDGGLREWFFHGRDVYDKRRSQMKEIASRAGIEHMCRMLDETFDDRMFYWKRKYNPTSLDTWELVAEELEEDFEFEAHSGVECVEYVEVSIPQVAEIVHTCKNGVEYLWFTPLPGPHLPVNYVKLAIVILPFVWQFLYNLSIVLFVGFTLVECRKFVYMYMKIVAIHKRAEREMLGLRFEMLREHPHLAAAA